MSERLHLRPGVGHVRYRIGVSPPNYKLASPEIVAQVAGKLAEVFNLKSSGINFNQNALSTNFLSFRYFLPIDIPGIALAQIPYLDVAVGADQLELFFSNPPTVIAVRDTYLRVLDVIIGLSTPTITEHYLEASLHAPGDNVNVQKFFDEVVGISTKLPLDKGFSFALTLENNARAAMNLDTSIVIKGGVFIFFTYTAAQKVQDISSIGSIVESAVGIYREFQSIANIEIEEPRENQA